MLGGEPNVSGAKGDRQHGAEACVVQGPDTLVRRGGFLGFGEEDKKLASMLMYIRVFY